MNPKVESTFHITVVVLGVVLLFGWLLSTCVAPCSWFGWLPLTAVPSRCLPSMGGPQ